MFADSTKGRIYEFNEVYFYFQLLIIGLFPVISKQTKWIPFGADGVLGVW